MKDNACHKCNKTGHIQRACRTGGGTSESKGAWKKRGQKVTSGYAHAEGAEVDTLPVLNAEVTGERSFSVELKKNAVNVKLKSS